LSWNKHPTKWSSNKHKNKEKKCINKTTILVLRNQALSLPLESKDKNRTVKMCIYTTERSLRLNSIIPPTKVFIAKISLNGNRISNSGVVLKPGQRVFLERYLDEDRKFLFETYEVSDSKTNQRAIENNGLVIVEFFNKMLFTNYGHLGGYTYLNNQPLLYGSGNVNVNGNPIMFTTTGTWKFKYRRKHEHL